MSAMITVEEALARVLASAEAPLEEEKVALEAGLRPCAGARHQGAQRTQPPFANSAMDGYAVRAADTAQAPADLDGDRRVGGGPRFRGRPRSGRSGAHLHRRADARRRRRHRHSGGCPARGRPHLALRPPCSLATICAQAGMDFRAGEALIAAGRRLTPRDVALAAAANHTALSRSADAPGSRSWRPATNWSRPAGRWVRRRSSLRTITPSPGSSRRRRRSRSTSASPSMSSARSGTP